MTTPIKFCKKSINTEERCSIKTLKELETAGVLATSGLQHLVCWINLVQIDMTCVPNDIAQNLMKIVIGDITLKEVNGFCVSLLKNSKCKRLFLENMSLQEIPASQEPSISCDFFQICNLRGDISGLLKSVKCQRLCIKDMAIPKMIVEKEINVRDDVTLNNVQGDVVEFIKNIKCQRLIIENLTLAQVDNTATQTFYMDELRFHNVEGYVGGLLESIKCKRLVLRKTSLEQSKIRGPISISDEVILIGNEYGLIDNITCHKIMHY